MVKALSMSNNVVIPNFCKFIYFILPFFVRLIRATYCNQYILLYAVVNQYTVLDKFFLMWCSFFRELIIKSAGIIPLHRVKVVLCTIALPCQLLIIITIIIIIIIIIIILYSAVSLLNQQHFTTVNDKENWKNVIINYSYNFKLISKKVRLKSGFKRFCVLTCRVLYLMRGYSIVLGQ